MRYRLMATYRGSPFEAGIGPSDGDIVLFAACPPPEDLGFEPATGHWRKQLPISEVQAVWESRPVGTFRGERCMVLDDLGDRMHIGYLGHDGYRAEQLGYWQVDRGVFELVAARTEVSEVVEERTEYPREPARAQQPLAAGAPPAGDRQSQRAGNGQSAPADPPVAAGPDGYLPARPDLTPVDYFRPAAAPSLADFDRPAGPDTGSYTRPADFNRPPGPNTGPADFNSADFDRPAGPDTGSYTRPAGFESGDFSLPASPDSNEHPAAPGGSGPLSRPVFRSVKDEVTGFSLPSAAEPPLPLEAAAMRAASSRRPRTAAAQRRSAVPPSPSSAPVPPPGPSASGRPAAAAAPGLDLAPDAPPPAAGATGTGSADAPSAANAPGLGTASSAANLPRPASAGGVVSTPGLPGQAAPALRARRSARRRLATERLFAELVGRAAIPVDSYAIGEEVEGALCLLQTEQGFEVFHSADGNRHEVQLFATEESACFYLFGVLAAEAVRNGSLVPGAGQLQSAQATS
jgi:hypothetical protein